MTLPLCGVASTADLQRHAGPHLQFHQKLNRFFPRKSATPRSSDKALDNSPTILGSTQQVRPVGRRRMSWCLSIGWHQARLHVNVEAGPDAQAPATVVSDCTDHIPPRPLPCGPLRAHLCLRTSMNPFRLLSCVCALQGFQCLQTHWKKM